MTKTYTEELNALIFSEEEKTEILERLTLSAGSPAFTNRASSAEETSSNKTSTDEKPTDETSTEKKAHGSRLTVPIILLLLFSLVGGTAYAVTEGLVEVPAPLQNIFGQIQNSESVGKIGYPLGISVSDAGITMTAETVMGDETHIAVLYSLKREDGQAFPPAQTNADGSLMYFFNNPMEPDYNAPQPLAHESASFSTTYFYADENDASTIYYVELYGASTDSFIGEKYTSHYENLGVLKDPCLGEKDSSHDDCSTTFTPIAEGNWDFSFTVNYEDMTKRIFTSGATIGSGDGKVTITQVYVSPLSVRFVGFANNRNFGNTEEAQTGTEPSNKPEIKKVELIMRDGTTKVFSPQELSMESTHTYIRTSWEYSQIWGEIIDVNEVRAVRINDVEISLD
ncbi:MAG: DUF4179 domain-containing protein [Actinomycetaceae bacterium]|nr:DUF4179 domain-containing protein [Actinomycetaceae bacterium]